MTGVDSERSGIDALVDVIAALRSENGCPWDREQTHTSLKKFLVEECAELLDAIDDGDDECIKEELGDILMHIVFHAHIAEVEERFDFDDVAKGAAEKMVRRHPHVFGSEKADSPEDVLVIWKAVKKKEKGDIPESVLDGIPRHMPALARATELQKRAASKGFDWGSPQPILDKIEEELGELRAALDTGDERHVEEEIGDLLFAVVNFARFRKGTPAEELLARANGKFQQRFHYVEKMIAAAGKTLEETSIDEMEKLWEEAKGKSKPEARHPKS